MFVVAAERDGRVFVVRREDESDAQASYLRAQAAGWRNVRLVEAFTDEAWDAVVTAALYEVLPEEAAELRAARGFGWVIQRVRELVEDGGMAEADVLRAFGGPAGWYLPEGEPVEGGEWSTPAMVLTFRLEPVVAGLWDGLGRADED